MTNNLKNIKKSVSNTVGAATSVVSVTTEMVADVSGLLSNSIGATPAVLRALLASPFSAAKGYLMEAEGLSEQEAERAAFKYLEQNLALTIAQGGEGAGKLLAQLLADDEAQVDTADKKTAQH